jgi:hypothetical protein
MQFQPCETLNKNTHVSEKWTAEKLNMVASTRRVIGFGGAFPPYEALVDKFQKEKNFMEAFTLRPIQTT